MGEAWSQAAGPTAERGSHESRPEPDCLGPASALPPTGCVIMSKFRSLSVRRCLPGKSEG